MVIALPYIVLRRVVELAWFPWFVDCTFCSCRKRRTRCEPWLQCLSKLWVWHMPGSRKKGRTYSFTRRDICCLCTRNLSMFFLFQTFVLGLNGSIQTGFCIYHLKNLSAYEILTNRSIAEYCILEKKQHKAVILMLLIVLITVYCCWL